MKEQCLQNSKESQLPEIARINTDHPALILGGNMTQHSPTPAVKPAAGKSSRIWPLYRGQNNQENKCIIQMPVTESGPMQWFMFKADKEEEYVRVPTSVHWDPAPPQAHHSDKMPNIA